MKKKGQKINEKFEMKIFYELRKQMFGIEKEDNF